MPSTIRRRRPGLIATDGAMRWHARLAAGLAVVKCARPIPAAMDPMSNINPDPFTTRPEIEGTLAS
jgi:hypothetical protein